MREALGMVPGAKGGALEVECACGFGELLELVAGCW